MQIEKWEQVRSTEKEVIVCNIQESDIKRTDVKKTWEIKLDGSVSRMGDAKQYSEKKEDNIYIKNGILLFPPDLFKNV